MIYDQRTLDLLSETYPNRGRVEEIMGYIVEGRPPGGFLEALLRNDLFGAVAEADASNGLILRDLVRWVQSYAPKDCHGSQAAVERWVSRRGLSGEVQNIEDTLNLDKEPLHMDAEFDEGGKPRPVLAASPKRSLEFFTDYEPED